jgi:hypothetical protein
MTAHEIKPGDRLRGRRLTLLDRIDAILLERGPLHLSDLETALWPDRASHRPSSNGGPPGCRMVSSAAVTRGGYPRKHLGGSFGNCIISPRHTKPVRERQQENTP